MAYLHEITVLSYYDHYPYNICEGEQLSTSDCYGVADDARFAVDLSEALILISCILLTQNQYLKLWYH